MKKTVSFSKNSKNLFFHILTNCNLKCKHCYINKEQHGTNMLSSQSIEKWLRAFSDDSKETNVIFLGGEPTLHPDLPFAVKIANKLKYNSITIDTNGYLFNDVLLKIRPNEVDFISFSLDGATKQTNDMIRGNGSFEKCTTGIMQAVDKGFNTSLIYTVSQDNIHELEMMASLLTDLRVERFFIQVIGIRGESAKKADDEKNSTLQVQHKTWSSVIPDVAEKIAQSGIIVTYPKVFLKATELFECAGIVADNYFIFPNGRVYRCPLCEDFPIHSMTFKNNRLVNTNPLNENNLFQLNIPEGCVMNKLVQPENLAYKINGIPKYKIACCMLKEEISFK